jgi:hypothetical protein
MLSSNDHVFSLIERVKSVILSYIRYNNTTHNPWLLFLLQEATPNNIAALDVVCPYPPSTGTLDLTSSSPASIQNKL